MREYGVLSSISEPCWSLLSLAVTCMHDECHLMIGKALLVCCRPGTVCVRVFRLGQRSCAVVWGAMRMVRAASSACMCCCLHRTLGSALWEAC